MKSLRIEHAGIPDSVVRTLKERDAILWIGHTQTNSPAWIEAAARLIGLPWKMVLCEEHSVEFVQAIETRKVTEDSFDRVRGFIHIVASDPEGTDLPPRSLPVFLLNGRSDSRDPSEMPNLGVFGAMRRRLNMLKLLVEKRARMIVLVSDGADNPLQDIQVLWKQEGLRSLLAIISNNNRDTERLDAWLKEGKAPLAIDHCIAPLPEVVQDLSNRLASEISEGKIVVRIRNPKGEVTDIDITSAELVERPLLESYEIIQSKDLRLLHPNELSRQDLEDFFSRTKRGWRPFAAGIPWPREPEARRSLTETLTHVAETGSTDSQILKIVSESGAGGTTFARSLAFSAAIEGFPTLIALPGVMEFPALELSRFLHAVHVQSVEKGLATIEDKDTPRASISSETPWVIVFDVPHWEGRDAELRGFLSSLRNDGRSVVILAICSPSSPADLGRSSRVKQIAHLRHELALAEALKLGDHLNRFLKVFGKERSRDEWQSFWEAHKPDYIISSIAHFWIALEFWLKGQIDLNQSIQKWLYDSFHASEMSDKLRLVVLEIAALSIERQPLPEELIPLSEESEYPYSVLLESERVATPALALVREMVGAQKLWAIAHDLLARYLLTATFFDHAMLCRLGLAEATDPIRLRLLLLRRVACRPELALRRNRKLANVFALKILKLDADGNAEFVGYWREVLSILESIPAGVRQTSRAFNHHFAVSMRRVAKQHEFEVENAERKLLLERAVKHIEYALNELEQSPDDESDLNLLNSLALAYQDLADVQHELGAPADLLTELRAKATEATRRALQQDPTNSYVLETTAKDLIQQGEHYPESAVASATEALGYIFQAISLERAESRQFELTRLANRALGLLRRFGDALEMRRLAASGNSLGTLAEAWLRLTEGLQELRELDFNSIPPANIDEALAIIESSPLKSNWMLLRFKYDLLVARRPTVFVDQLALLDELQGTSFDMPLQLQLEHAILLHQLGRHFEANRMFYQIRKSLKNSDTVVEVPNRLFWLRSALDRSLRVCDAQVVETRGQRAIAKTRELLDEMVPFIPQEFGVSNMRAGTRFKCSVNFGRLGPFLKPPQSHQVG